MYESSTAHLSPQTGLIPALNSWEMYLNDQGRSLNTVKAFLSDVRLLTQVLPPDRTLGDITTGDRTNLGDFKKLPDFGASLDNLLINRFQGFIRQFKRKFILYLSPDPVITANFDLLKGIQHICFHHDQTVDAIQHD